MKKNVSFIDEFAVSEVVGAMILVLIAIVVFAAIYMYVFPLPIPAPEPTVKLKGYVTDDGTAVLEHMGGESLSEYRIDVRKLDGALINTTTYKRENDPWEIGECNYPPTNTPLLTENDKVNIDVYEIYNDGSEHQVFTGILTGKRKVVEPSIPSMLMLISSLKTNSIDEDLICYSYTIRPGFTPVTFIYNWMVASTGPSNPLTRLLMPFDTQNTVYTRDYSGYNHNGTIVGATWTAAGKVGGAYSYAGHGYISVPYCFDTAIHQLTAEVWVKTNIASGTIISYDREKYCELSIVSGKVKWSTNASDGIVDLLGTSTINNNVWHYLVATYDSGTGEGSIYVDGRLDANAQLHRVGSLLGSGDSIVGALGKSASDQGRISIFSTSFEMPSEKNNWSENNSGAADIKDYVDNNTSNVDNSTDKGAETNFANAQATTTDNNVMTIQENAINGTTSTFGVTTTRTSTTTLDNYMCGLNATTSGGSNGPANYIMAYLKKSSSSGSTWTVKGALYYQSNSTLIASTQERTITPTTNWAWYQFNFTGAKPILKNGVTYRIFIWTNDPTGTLQLGTYTSAGSYKRGYKSSTYSSWPSTMTGLTYTDGEYSLYCQYTTQSYQIDFEYQWTAAVYNMANKQVCIYVTSHTGTENLLVNYWTGSTWSSLGAITVTGWSNFTATGLTSSTYTIQLKGASESSDSAQDSWNIDAALLHLWTNQGIFDILPSTLLNPHNGSSYSIGGSGDFDPDYDAYNRTGIDISNYKNVTVSVWYSYKDTKPSDFLGLYYFSNHQWVPIFNKTNLPNGGGQSTWTNVQVQLPTDLTTLYLQFRWRTSSLTEYVAIDDLNITGIPRSSAGNFTGVIDEVKFYERILSQEQIYQNYLGSINGNSSRSVLVSEETILDENWKCIVTPNDGTQDGVPAESNIITILNYPGGGTLP